MTAANWSLWGHEVSELKEEKPQVASSGTAIPQGMPSPWLEGSLLLLPSWPLSVKMIPESKLTSSETTAGPHRDTRYSTSRNKLPGHTLWCSSWRVRVRGGE